jgi:protein involved in polysaccharide export with SLBB domain
MLNFPRIVVTGVLLASCLSALAQDKSDYFGQAAPSAGEGKPVSPFEAPPKRVMISNAAAKNASAVATQSTPAPDSEPVAAPSAAQVAEEPDSSGGANEFQRFISDSSGQQLPLFGSEFFANAPTTFAPVGNAPVPGDYVLGVGDELLIRGWGSIDIDYRAKIDRNGLISIPTVGSVVLAGVSASQAEAVVRGAIGRLYKGVTVSVNFGQLRAITVYVVGQARRPGTYTVSGLSTLVTAVFASGGPNGNGSMRRIQIKRGAAVVAEVDLYAFLGKGDKSTDVKLRDGDIIFIPRAVGHVAMTGKVNSPAIYELRGANDTIESLLEYAGGMPVSADPRRAFLERIDQSRNLPRSVEQFELNAAGLRRTLKNGDLVNVTSITPNFSNAVVLRGNVDQPVRVPFKPGMRVSDLIPSREYLITRDSVKRQNNALEAEQKESVAGQTADSIAARIGSLIDEVNWDYAVVERVNPSDLTVSLVPFNLGNMFANPASSDNVLLQPGDTVTIFSQKDVAVPMDKRRVFVRIEGEVNVPGVYKMAAGETLHSLMARAGGPTGNAFLFGTEFYREQARRQQEANLQKAVNRLESQMRSQQSAAVANTRGGDSADAILARRQAEQAAGNDAISRLRQLKPTGRITFNLDPEERSFSRLPRLKLENGDRMVVPARVDFVHVFGAVNVEASSLWRPNSRVNDYLKVAGLTVDADKDNVFILRVDGSVVSRDSSSWSFGGFGGIVVMPGDSIVVPEKFDKETAWTKFTQGTREWAQIFANFGLGAAAIQVLK